MDLNKARFLPFDALNEFMRDDYRLKVVTDVLFHAGDLPRGHQEAIEKITRKVVQLPGFRNSSKAPAPLRLKGTSDAFTKNAALVAVILSAWSELHAPLRQEMYDLLTERGWGVYPTEADRTRLPGFMVTWPKNEEFDVLTAAFREHYPESSASDDDISLMAVWVSVRLPYQLEDDEEEETALDAGVPDAGDAAAGAVPAA